jgi:hypothetical protein
MQNWAQNQVLAQGSTGDQLAWLKTAARSLQQQLEQVQARIAELEKPD